jgi:hypothetical protein
VAQEVEQPPSRREAESTRQHCQKTEAKKAGRPVLMSSRIQTGSTSGQSHNNPPLVTYNRVKTCTGATAAGRDDTAVRADRTWLSSRSADRARQTQRSEWHHPSTAPRDKDERLGPRLSFRGQLQHGPHLCGHEHIQEQDWTQSPH